MRKIQLGLLTQLYSRNCNRQPTQSIFQVDCFCEIYAVKMPHSMTSLRPVISCRPYRQSPGLKAGRRAQRPSKFRKPTASFSDHSKTKRRAPAVSDSCAIMFFFFLMPCTTRKLVPLSEPCSPTDNKTDADICNRSVDSKHAHSESHSAGFCCWPATEDI